MIKNIRHSGIVVRDIIESYNFYVDLGFMIESDEIEKGKFLDTILGIDGCEIRVMKMSCGNQMIELLEYKEPKSKDFEKKINSIGCSHLAMTVYDIESVYKKLTEQGVEFINPPESNEKVKVAFCKDPNDVWLELVEEL
jgi:4-hydroxyphenylpyruvate dioxygenase-like putative hemolysin|tara:strand:+ start:977 stop:1393 length:417 start_codon:yes stop_codon:yes gene_type:complete